MGSWLEATEWPVIFINFQSMLSGSSRSVTVAAKVKEMEGLVPYFSSATWN